MANVLLAVSFACQAASAALAARRARRGPGRAAWSALATAVALLAVHTAWAPPGQGGDAAGLLGVAASLALVGGLAAVAGHGGTAVHALSPGPERRDQEFLALAEHTPDLVTRHDREGRVVYCNPAAADVLRRPREEVLGLTPQQLTAEAKSGQALHDAVMAVVQGGKPVDFELVNEAGGGAPRPVYHVRVVPELQDGRVSTVLATGRDITALKDAELRWRTLVENDPDLVARFDLAGRHVYVNPAVLRAGGFSPGEILGKTHLEVDREITPELRRSLCEAVHATISDGAPRSLETVLPVPGGEACFDFRFYPERAPSGEVASVLCVGRDITSRREAERKLRDSEERMRLALEAARVAAWDWDLEHDRWYPSPGYYTTLGYAPREGPGDREEWLARVHPEERAEVRDRIATVLAQRLGEHSYEARLLHADGTYRWQLVRGYVGRRDAAGKVARILGVRVDIDDRKKADEALRRRERELREAQRLGRLGSWSWDPRTDRITGSEESHRIYGRDHACPPPPYAEHLKAYTPESAARLDAAVQRSLRTGEPYELDLELADAGRETRWITARSEVLRGAQGEIVALRGTVQDITDRRRAEEALRQSEEQLRQVQKLEAIGRLAGGVAHDFNNLLTAILGNAQVLAEQLDPSDPLRTEAQEIEAAAQQAAAVTRQLLTFGRRQAVSPRTVDPAALVEDMDRTLRRLVGEEVEVTTVVHPGVGCVHVDPAQLEQVLLNLVLNARDAMPAGGRLRLEIAEVDVTEGDEDPRLGTGPGPYVRIAVRDSGAGMTPEVQAHLFEPFYTTKGPGRGTGLGLATVYGIVRQAGGDVRVESALGSGTSVEVYLPRRRGTAGGRPVTPPPGPARGSETVLLVEDEPMVRALAVRVLRRAGFTVLEASDGEQALSLAADPRNALDLLLTDVIMPRLGGPELADRLRADRPDLPVLFASGYVERVVDVQTRLGRATGFIPKPFTPAELTRKVRELLDAAAVARAGRT